MRSCSLVDAVADLGEVPGGPPSFFSEQTEAWGTEKNVLETARPHLISGSEWRWTSGCATKILKAGLTLNDTTKQESICLKYNPAWYERSAALLRNGLSKVRIHAFIYKRFKSYANGSMQCIMI